MINASLVSAQNRKRLFWVGQISSKKGKYEPVEIRQPKDRGIMLKDILEDGANQMYQTPRGKNKGGVKTGKAPTLTSNSYEHNNKPIVLNKDGSEKLKSNTIRSSGRGSGIGDKHNWDTIRTVDEKYFLSKQTLESTRKWNNAQAGRIRNTEGKSVTLQAGGGGTGAKTGLYTVPFIHDTGAILERVRKLTPIECERLQGLPDNYTEGLSNTQRYKTLGNAFNVDVVTHILKMLNLK
jgi:DNA (cytosine-5)-methyltransferase 3A